MNSLKKVTHGSFYNKKPDGVSESNAKQKISELIPGRFFDRIPGGISERIYGRFSVRIFVGIQRILSSGICTGIIFF